MTDQLPSPARYVPFDKGTYDVLPGLRPFGFEFGNGPADACVFQMDSQFSRFRSAKLDARRDAFGRHVLFDRYSESAAAEVAAFIAYRLVNEHPQWFSLSEAGANRRLDCSLSRESLCFDREWRLVDADRSEAKPPYTCALDALACQIQEDLAVTCADDSAHWLAALHVCLPSHWRPEEKLGQDFAQVHMPVPGMQPYIQTQDKFIGKMLGATSGLVRFVWGLQWSEELNRHPDRCSGAERFDPHLQNALLRVERQTIWGLPASRSSLFTIRPYLMPVAEIRQNRALADALAAAVASMSDDSLRYKGFLQDKDTFIAWLTQPAT